MKRFLLTGLLAFSCAPPLAAQSDEASSTHSQVDLRPALIVGKHAVSVYRADTAFERYVSQARHYDRRALTPERIRKWQDQFVAEQTIIAAAEEQDYLERPEIQTSIAAIKRRWLTDTSGIVYQQWFRQPPIPENELKQFYAFRSTDVDADIARFDNQAMAARLLGKDFDSIEAERQTKRLVELSKHSSVWIPRSSTWPYSCPLDVAAAVVSAKIGRWTRKDAGALGHFLIFVRKCEQRPTGNFENDRKTFESSFLQADRENVQNRRRAEVLVSAKFKIESSTLFTAVKAWNSLPHGTQHLTSLRQLSGKPLFEYEKEGREVAIMVEEYVLFFNQQFIITAIPRELSEFRETMENMILADYDQTTAAAEGIDRSPRFVEDLNDYIGGELLFAYLNEHTKRVRFTDEDVDKYYREHIGDFIVPTKVRGRVGMFKTEKEAEVWLSENTPGSGAGGSGPTQKVLPTAAAVSTIEVDMEHPLPIRSLLTDTLLAAPLGSTVGPERNKDSYIAFIKDQNVSTGPLSLARARRLIGSILDIEETLNRILALAKTVTPAGGVEKHFELTRSNEALNTPASSGSQADEIKHL